jgi:hypothetical protein
VRRPRHRATRSTSLITRVQLASVVLAVLVAGSFAALVLAMANLRASNERVTRSISSMPSLGATGTFPPLASAFAECASAEIGPAMRRPNSNASATASKPTMIAVAAIAYVVPRSSASTSCAGTPVAIVQPQRGERRCAV